jgi:Uncharacterized protein, putative amidase
MGYSIFQNTMVDMTYLQIEKAIEKVACVLLPVSVVEEHGPHLCTGTDIYLTQKMCEKISSGLNAIDRPTVIAPPFYWGVNSITNGFVGSFTISPNTMETLVLEILSDLQRWGFEKIFLLNFHGDSVHIKNVVQIAKKASEEKQLETYFVSPTTVLEQIGISDDVPYLLQVKLSAEALSGMQYPFFDIHAGAIETSWMQLDYSEVTDERLARQLEATSLTLPELMEWLHGGEAAKVHTPLGYCGAPAAIDLEKAKYVQNEIVKAYMQVITSVL